LEASRLADVNPCRAKDLCPGIAINSRKGEKMGQFIMDTQINLTVDLFALLHKFMQTE
jgi:hypothetical protein